jgi:2-C-methyl-D-erythritol 4-phosphate cytidylyltransferase
MGSDIPKQFLHLAGQPMLMHSLRAFHSASPGVEIVITLPSAQIPKWSALITEFGFAIPHRVIEGGLTRFLSVKNGLDMLDEDGLVAIHDGARPLVSEALIRRVYETAELHGTAIPVLPAVESLRMISGETSQSVDRTQYRVVQTPQVFLLTLIKKAFRQASCDTYPDDASVLEAAGETVFMVEGEARNIKVTRPDDLVIAQALINRPFHL